VPASLHQYWRVSSRGTEHRPCPAHRHYRVAVYDPLQRCCEGDNRLRALCNIPARRQPGRSGSRLAFNDICYGNFARSRFDGRAKACSGTFAMPLMSGIVLYDPSLGLTVHSLH
jgi:hypothetical protein